LAEPAFVFPGAASNIDVAGRKIFQTRGERVAIECGGIIK